MDQTKNDNYEWKFSRLGFMIRDLLNRYNNISNIKEIDISEQIPTYRTIIKDHLHKDMHLVKDWLDRNYFSKDKTPLGTYINQKFNELEEKLGNGDSNDEKKITLSNILSDICDSLPDLRYKMI